MERLYEPGAVDLCNDLLFVNIWWGMLNLLPILPLDGGRITNEVLNICHPRGALQISLWVSVVVATAMAATGLLSHDWFRLLLFGSLAYSSFQMLAAYSRLIGDDAPLAAAALRTRECPLIAASMLSLLFCLS